MSLGWRQAPNKKPFRKLFDNKTFIIHFAVQLVIALFGYYRCVNGHYRETLFLAPVLYLLLLRLSDPIIVSVASRHIYIVGRGDPKPTDYKWYLDAPLSLLIVMLPLCNSMLLSNYFRFGVYGFVH